jgi:hypothetical protein
MLILNKILLKYADIIICLPSKDDLSFKSISIENYDLEYIETITEKYKTLIGGGGFGSVYRGTTIPDKHDVAVKVRSAMSTQGTREFENEVIVYFYVSEVPPIITFYFFIQQLESYI